MVHEKVYERQRDEITVSERDEIEREAALPVAKSPEREITREARSDENENERPPQSVAVLWMCVLWLPRQ